jgi:hypothetical protein
VEVQLKDLILADYGKKNKWAVGMGTQMGVPKGAMWVLEFWNI